MPPLGGGMEIDMKKTAIFLCILALLFVSCAEKTVDLPMPADLFAAIEASVELSEMVDVSEDFLESNLGVLPADYRGAVYYIVSIGASCEEIIIIRAADEAKAEEIEEKLAARLAYVEKSANNYLTEYLPMIDSAVIRRDGLTVSLIISDHVMEIEAVFDSYSR